MAGGFFSLSQRSFLFFITFIGNIIRGWLVKCYSGPSQRNWITCQRISNVHVTVTVYYVYYKQIIEIAKCIVIWWPRFAPLLLSCSSFYHTHFFPRAPWKWFLTFQNVRLIVMCLKTFLSSTNSAWLTFCTDAWSFKYTLFGLGTRTHLFTRYLSTSWPLVPTHL